MNTSFSSRCKESIRYVAGASLALSFFLLVGSGTAFAAEPALVAAPQAPNSSIGQNISRNWSGYVTTGNTYTGITGTWTVPTVSTTNSATADATWVGIGGAATTDLVQAGTQAITENGQILYQAWYETLPNASTIVPLTVSPGDSITSTLTEQSNDNWLITITDNTTNQTYSTTINYESSLSSAEWIEEMPSDTSGNFVPLDSFGSVAFSNAQATVNGVSETALESGASAITMTTGAQVLASPSSLGEDGESFTVTRSSASSDITPFTVTIPRGGHWRGSRGAQGFSSGSSAASSTQSEFTSGGQTFRIIRYFSIPSFASSTQGTTQTFSFGNGTISVQFGF